MIRLGPPGAAREGNACAALTAEEYAAVSALAARYLEARGGFTAFLSSTGGWVQQGLQKLPAAWKDSFHAKARDSLWWAYRQAILGMDEKETGKRSLGLMYRLMATGSGLVTGAAGLPGVLADIPASTLLVLRSIADLARAQGHDIRDPAIQALCIEALAFGGPTDEDDDADLAFWSARAAAPVIADLVIDIAGRFGSRLLAVLPARAVPMISVIVAGAINWHFTGFFQNMAAVLLELKPIEDRYDRAMVRACFAQVVREQRSLRR